MTEDKINKPIKSADLSKKSQLKLEEIRKKQGFKTIDETIKYLTGFFEKK